MPWTHTRKTLRDKGSKRDKRVKLVLSNIQLGIVFELCKWALRLVHCSERSNLLWRWTCTGTGRKSTIARVSEIYYWVPRIAICLSNSLQFFFSLYLSSVNNELGFCRFQSLCLLELAGTFALFLSFRLSIKFSIDDFCFFFLFFLCHHFLCYLFCQSLSLFSANVYICLGPEEHVGEKGQRRRQTAR